MTTDTVQQIKDKLSIIDVVSQYVKLERAGIALRARCPFHSERTPSFIVSPDRNTFHCFGCGVGGDMFSFVMQAEGIDFKGALKILADRAGVPLVYTAQETGIEAHRTRLLAVLENTTAWYESRLTSDACEYLTKRGLHDDTIKQFRIGEAGNNWTDCVDFLRSKKFTDSEILEAGVGKKNERGTISDKFRNRIIFPLSDSAGRVVGFSGRTFGPHASPEAPKYLNTSETDVFHKSRVLYGYDKAKQAMRTLNCAILVEGQMDLLLSHQAGWANTVAVSGTAFTEDHALMIKRLTENILIALDGDSAGIKAAARAAHAAIRAGLNVKVVVMPDGLDPADLILTTGADAWKERIKNAKDIIQFLLDVLETHAKDSSAFRRTVESSVLPFVKDTPSPIAREQYITLIAHRLSVPETAVRDTLTGIVATPESHQHTGAPIPPHQRSDRAKIAYAVLLWQQKHPTPQINIELYASRLQEYLGESFAQFVQLSENEQEALRFEAEQLYGISSSLSRDIDDILRYIQIDTLKKRQEEIAQTLTQASTSSSSVCKQANLSSPALTSGMVTGKI